MFPRKIKLSSSYHIIPAGSSTVMDVEGSVFSHEELSYVGKLVMDTTFPSVPTGETGRLDGYWSV